MNTITEESPVDLKQRQRFSRLLGCEGEVRKEVVVSAVRSEEYFRNLMICRGHDKFFSHLLLNPSLPQDDIPDKEEIDAFIQQWETRLKHKALKDNFNKKYGKYIHLENDSQESKGQEGKCQEGIKVPVYDFREVYLDHNATTRPRPEVSGILADYAQGKFGYGNPGNLNLPGYYAADYVIDARIRIAKCLQVKPQTICFTGSGTEANNTAIKGIALAHWQEKGHIITTKAEHKSVLQTMEYLESLGFEITRLDVDSMGRVSPELIEQAIRDNTILVSVIMANNEIGAINPIKEIGAVCKEAGVPLMSDAVQAFGKLPLAPAEMNVSLMTFSGHKVYGPKGIGGLYVAKEVSLVPLIHGGGQEFGLRSGTENMGHIIAFGVAAELAHKDMPAEAERLTHLRDYFLKQLAGVEPGYQLNGPLEDRIPNNLSIGFPGVDSRALQKSLNRIGISVSIGSACSAKTNPDSHVLKAIAADTLTYGTIRFGFGRDTGKEDIDYLFEYLGEILDSLKSRQ